MSWALARHETRRAGWPALAAVPAVLAAGVLLALVLEGKGHDPAAFAGFWLREFIPLAFGLAVVAVPAAERCLEVQLSLPTPVVRTLGRRVGWCALWSAASTVGVALAAGLSGTWSPAYGLLSGQLTWLSPTIALIGVGAAVFAVSGTVNGAGATVAGLWLVQDLSGQWFTSHQWTRLLYLFAADDHSVPAAWWWANRLTLLAAGMLLVAFAAVMLSARQEQVLAGRLRHQGEDS